MTFKDLRPEIQAIAALALRNYAESRYHEEGKTVDVAKDIKAAFVELFSDVATSQNIEGAAGAIPQAITFHLNVAKPKACLVGEETINPNGVIGEDAAANDFYTAAAKSISNLANLLCHATPGSASYRAIVLTTIKCLEELIRAPMKHVS